MKRHYKVVRIEGASGRRVSVVQAGYSQVEYRLGEWAQRPRGCGPMCVFSTRRAAVQFGTDVCTDWFAERPKPVAPHEVWRVEIQPTRFKSVWDDEGGRFHAGNLPEGTVLALKVKPIACVHSHAKEKA